MIFTGVLALVACLQLATFVWQIRSTGSATEKEIRAYVFPATAKRFRSDGVMKIQITLSNSGKTPAHNCTNWLRESYPPANEPYEFPGPGTEREDQDGRSKYTLGPGTEIDILFDAVVPPQQDQEAIENGIRSLYIHGEVQYTDVVNKTHLSKFRLVCTGRNFNAGLFSVCPDGNEAS